MVLLLPLIVVSVIVVAAAAAVTTLAKSPYLRVSDESSGDGHPLLLSPAEAGPSFSHQRVVTIRQTVNKTNTICQYQSMGAWGCTHVMHGRSRIGRESGAYSFVACLGHLTIGLGCCCMIVRVGWSIFCAGTLNGGVVDGLGDGLAWTNG